MNKTRECNIKAVRKYEATHYSQIAVKIDKTLVEQVRAKAKAEGVSVRGIIVQAFKGYLET